MKFPLLILAEKLRTTRCAMIDLETLDQANTAAPYAIGARMFVPGLLSGEPMIDPDEPYYQIDSPDFLQYIEPSALMSDWRFTKSADTIEWTLRKNQAELDRAYKFGDDVEAVLLRFKEWYEHNKPEYIFANSPSFDVAILRHAFRALDIEDRFIDFRSEMDVRTIRELLGWMGQNKYGKVEGARLHSPLGDCSMQILDVHRFVTLLGNGE